MKICFICKIEQDDNNFAAGRTRCKECIKKYNKIYRSKNKEDIKIQRKQYYNNNEESILKKKQIYYIDNKSIDNIRKSNKVL